MLDNKQAEFLVNKGIIKIGSMIQVNKKTYYGQLIPDYKVTKIKKNLKDDWLVSAQNIDEPEKLILTNVCNIVTLDDMPVERMLGAYMVDEELNTINVVKKTNVEKTIIGKKTAKLNGIELEDGMHIILHNDTNKNLKNKVLTVRDVGNSIKLIAPRGRPKKK